MLRLSRLTDYGIVLMTHLAEHERGTRSRSVAASKLASLSSSPSIDRTRGRRIAIRRRLDHRARRLMQQHDRLRDAIDALALVASSADAAPESWRALREGSQAFAQELRRHESDESCLIQEAFMLDLGGGG